MRVVFREWVLLPRRARLRRQAKNCPIALASDRAKPSPRVCLCAGSSLAPREAGGANPLRRDAHCPSTGSPVGLRFGIAPSRWVATNLSEGLAPTLPRHGSTVNASGSAIFRLRPPPATSTNTYVTASAP